MSAEDSSPIIEARSLHRVSSRDGSVLLDGVSFSLCPGDCIALTGPTGVGKSVLLRTLSLLDPLDAGEVLWNGNPLAPANIPRYRAAVIHLQQRPVLFDTTVSKTLSRPFELGAHASRSFDQQFVRDLLSSCGFGESFLDRRTTELSGGESQIVALIRAIQLEPTVLLLDEPTASMDRESAQHAERLVREWYDDAPEQRATLWVTHQAEQVRRIADQHWTMESASRLVV